MVIARAPQARDNRAPIIGAAIPLFLAMAACEPVPTPRPATAEPVPPAPLVTPSTYGTWWGTLETTNVLAIHAALMPPKDSSTAAKILFFGGSQNDATVPYGRDNFRLYNTSTRVIQSPSSGITEDLFCSGHGHTKDGKLLIVGGNEYYAGDEGLPSEIPDELPPTENCTTLLHPRVMNIHKCPPPPGPPDRTGTFGGLKSSFVFDHATERFTRNNSMADGRWYPSVVRAVPNSRFSNELLALSGLTSATSPRVPDAPEDWEFMNNKVDAFNAAGQAWVRRGTLRTGGYPRAFLTPYLGGSIFTVLDVDSGKSAVLVPDGASGYFKSNVANPPDDGEYLGSVSSAVLLPLRPRSDGSYPKGKVMLTNIGFSTMVMDLDNPGAGWDFRSRPKPSCCGEPRSRWHGVATILATGDVIVTGGVAPQFDDGPGWNTYRDGHDGTEDFSVYYSEIYREDQDRWFEGPAAAVSRNYHSVALLMPNGKVWTAGGNWHAGPQRELRIELFEPWYTKVTGRPTITSTTPPPPSSGSWAIKTPDAGSIQRVALMAPGSVTHGFDSDQRYVELRITGRSTANSTVTVNVPGDRTVLPRGWYMLVISKRITHEAGSFLPSVARWYKVP